MGERRKGFYANFVKWKWNFSVSSSALTAEISEVIESSFVIRSLFVEEEALFQTIIDDGVSILLSVDQKKKKNIGIEALLSSEVHKLIKITKNRCR